MPSKVFVSYSQIFKGFNLFPLVLGLVGLNSLELFRSKQKGRRAQKLVAVLLVEQLLAA